MAKWLPKLQITVIDEKVNDHVQARIANIQAECILRRLSEYDEESKEALLERLQKML